MLKPQTAAPTRPDHLSPDVIILGAGPAGVGAAQLLAERGAAVLTLERQRGVGGNSASFELEGVCCDFGSHRLHPASEPHVLDQIKTAVGEDLLWRPRHGRILLRQRWIHFPLKPFDLVAKLPKAFTAALILDALTKPLRKRPAPDEETFASVLRHGLGPAMCETFYYPYVRKLWALPPDALAPTLAKRRVSGSSPLKILKKVARQLPLVGAKSKVGFYYPRKGFGQICAAMRARAEAAGARFELGASVTAIEHAEGRVHAVRWTQDGVEHRREPGAIWSTLPISALAEMMTPAAPDAVLQAARRIRFRGMILIYLVLEQDQFTEFDAHYFPELSTPISRLSEPKNYSASTEPRGVTVLCAELPSDPGDAYWDLDDDALGARLCEWLGAVGLPVTSKVRRTVTRRLRHAYPVYDRGFEHNLKIVEDWFSGFEGLLIYGRQGLFAHDNTHHALAMAHGAVDCLAPDGSFDLGKWAAYRRVFETHVVED